MLSTSLQSCKRRKTKEDIAADAIKELERSAEQHMPDISSIEPELSHPNQRYQS